MIAIDPGQKQSAWIVWHEGRIVAMAIEDNGVLVDRLDASGRFNFPGEGWARDYGPLVVEWVTTFGKPVGTPVFETVYWIGRFAEAWGGEERLTRQEIGETICGSRNARNSSIRQALIDRFGGVGGKAVAIGNKAKPGPLHGVTTHLWSALAVAVAYEARAD